METLAEALAIKYVTQYHWSLVPLDGKIPVEKNWTQRPPTTEPEAVGYAKAGGNIGVRTGAISGLIILDFDPKSGSPDDLLALSLPRTPTVITGASGFHFHFKNPPGVVIRNSAGKLAPGIDVRGEGGQAVLPPSVHPATRRPYVWQISPDVLPLADLPDEIIKRLLEPAAAPSNGTEGGIPPGQRNSRLTSLAGSMRRRAMSPEAILSALQEENRRRCDPPLSEKEVEQITRSIGRYPPALTEEPEPVLVGLEKVTPEEIAWLWPSHFARGKVNFLVGDPGVGKSCLSLDVAARISTGRGWPDGGAAEVGNTVLLTAEDGLADTVVPRLLGMGADSSRITALTSIKFASVERPFSLAVDLPPLEAAITRLNAVMVIIDPLSAYLGPTDSFKDDSVRKLLAPLATLAEKTGVAILGILHLNKKSGLTPLYRLGGSIAFTAAARSVFLVGKDPDNEERRILAPLKINIAAPPPPLAFSIDGRKVTWEDGPVTGLNVGDLLAGGPDESEERSARKEAADFLRKALADGERDADEVVREARTAGISDITLRRAKGKAGVKASRQSVLGGRRGAGKWLWRLADKEADVKDDLIETVRRHFDGTIV